LTMAMLSERLARVVDVVFGGNALEAASAAGMLPSTLHRLLQGSVQAPRLSTLKSLADTFGVPVGWLIGEVSTSGGQSAETPLAEVYWILQKFYRRKQLADREWIRVAASDPKMVNIPEIKEMINLFRNFRLMPDGGGTLPGRFLPPAIVDFTKSGTQPEVEIFRNLALLETHLLAVAVAKMKKMGAKTGAGPAPTNSRNGERDNQTKAKKK
jgi:transcriptional regulator with XRE-family HTH domain